MVISDGTIGEMYIVKNINLDKRTKENVKIYYTNGFTKNW